MRKMIASLTALFGAAATLCAPASADTVEITLPSGITVEQFGETMEKTASSGLGKERSFASAAVGLFSGSEILYTGYFGDIDIKGGIPADENSVYEWGSISKTFVWVSAMQLWERGLLDLNADIRGYLPEGFFRHLSYDDPITFMNLMNHNTGWQETLRPVETEDENAVLPLGEALQACEPAQIHRPGEVTAYSNYGAALGGYVIECISGTDYCEYVHKNILEPLGMSHTSVNPDHSDNDWVRDQRSRLHCYANQLGGLTDMGNCLSFIMPYPAGAVTGTLGDMMKYGQALVDDDAPLFLHKETQELMFAGTAFWGSSDIPSCAHGFWCEEYGVRTYGHSGATNAGQADLIFDPDSKTGLAVMVNELNGNVFLQSTPYAVFGALAPERVAAGELHETTVKGYYLLSRSYYRGLLRSLSYLTANVFDDKAYEAGNSLLLFGDESGYMMMSGKTYPDGTESLEYGSMELIRDDAYLAELILLTLYMIAAIAALYLVRYKRKLKKAGRFTAYAGAGVMTAGNIALVVSFVTWLATFVIYASDSGIGFAAGAAVGILQMLCCAVCTAAAVFPLVSMLTAKEKARTHIYILNAVLNAAAVGAVLYYEMYMFWGC